MMQADLNKSSSPHWYCSKEEQDYDLWLYYRNLAPMIYACWLDNMKLDFHNGQPHNHGVKIQLNGDRLSKQDDIERGFAKDLWGDLLSGVSSLGYSGTSPYVVGLHYDWRLSPKQLSDDGTFLKMKKQIEMIVATADGKRAIPITLSYGGPLMHTFLASYVDAAWKRKYVERWISLSGVFGGSVELTRMALYPEPADFYDIPTFLPYITVEMTRDLSNTFPSSFALQPSFLNQNDALVTAIIDGKNRTYYKTDFESVLSDAGLLAAREVYTFAKDSYSFAALGEPGVSVDCMYGVGDDSLSAIHFGDGFNSRATHFSYEDGDGVAPTRSLSLCRQWNITNRSGYDAPTFSEHVFPRVGHGGTLHNDDAVRRFAAIVHSVYRSSTMATVTSFIV
eukprot:TRINITY_DN65933_c0_g1_i1.p1 TRINITY_DN65933_c0_g1~~TRINITY_DN65933_c0_g1_i1.p1  ORF type:complete len:451 (-),score=28.19 TRINITY_DN65933_c0_g1_i1:165-1343(-)